MKKLLVALILLSSPALADRAAVQGYWSTGTSIFEVYEEDGALYGQIRALTSPIYETGEREGMDGQPRIDTKNPDPALRDRPLIGLHMFSGYQYDDGQWQGKIYDPESGNTYQSNMKVNRKGELEIRGYVGVPMFGRTARFEPISTCSENIVAMLEQLEEARHSC